MVAEGAELDDQEKETQELEERISLDRALKSDGGCGMTVLYDLGVHLFALATPSDTLLCLGKTLRLEVMTARYKCAPYPSPYSPPITLATNPPTPTHSNPHPHARNHTHDLLSRQHPPLALPYVRRRVRQTGSRRRPAACTIPMSDSGKDTLSMATALG